MPFAYIVFLHARFLSLRSPAQALIQASIAHSSIYVIEPNRLPISVDLKRGAGKIVQLYNITCLSACGGV